MALAISSAIDAVLPYTNYDTSVIWITCTDLSDLLPIQDALQILGTPQVQPLSYFYTP